MKKLIKLLFIIPFLTGCGLENNSSFSFSSENSSSSLNSSEVFNEEIIQKRVRITFNYPKLKDEGSYSNEEMREYYMSTNETYIKEIKLDKYLTNCYIYSTCSLVEFTFDINEYNKKIHSDFESLVKNEYVDKVVLIDITENFAIESINPYFYNLKENNKITFEFLDSIRSFYLPSGIYYSYSELEEKVNENESDKSKELMNQYKDFNFTDSALIISNKVTVESGSQQLSLQEVYLKDKVIYHFIKTNNPSICTDDQQERYFIYKIDKDILNNNIDYKLEMCY